MDAPATPRRKYRALILNLLLFALIFLGIRTWQHRDLPSGAAPGLQGTTLQGLPYSLPARPGKPMMVHFWAVWCPVCRTEEDSISAIARDHPDKVITVALNSGPPTAVSRYMEQQGIAYPVVNDPTGVIAAKWGIRAVPASFWITPDGRITSVETGYTTEAGMRLRLWLAK